MASPRWIGAAGAVAPVQTVQITAYDAATTYALICNSRVVSVAGVTSVNATASALQTACAASTYPEFKEVTFSVVTDTVTLTGKTAGKPITFSSSVSGGTGTIGSVTETTAATGPNHWDNTANWSTGSLPADGDTVYFDNSDVDVLYGLGQSTITPAAIYIAASYTGDIGLSEWNTDSTAYHEYRSQYLSIGDAGDGTNLVIVIGDGPGTGSRRLKLNTNACQTTLTVYNTSSGAETDLEALLWKGTHASNVVTVLKGSMGIAVFGGETATVATLNVGSISSSSDVKLRLGAGVTLTTLAQNGGDVQLNGAATTITKKAGTLTVRGSGAITTLSELKGTTTHFGTGTVTTLTVGGDGALVLDGSVAGITISACDVYKGARITDTNRRATWSAGIDLNQCRLSEVTLDVGSNVRITPGNVA